MDVVDVVVDVIVDVVDVVATAVIVIVNTTEILSELHAYSSRLPQRGPRCSLAITIILFYPKITLIKL